MNQKEPIPPFTMMLFGSTTDLRWVAAGYNVKGQMFLFGTYTSNAEVVIVSANSIEAATQGFQAGKHVTHCQLVYFVPDARNVYLARCTPGEGNIKITLPSALRHVFSESTTWPVETNQ